MLKRMFMIMILLYVSVNFVTITAHCKEDQYYEIVKTIAPYAVDEEDKTISREACLVSIMKAIGVDKESIEMMVQIDPVVPWFSDTTDFNNYENLGYIYLARRNFVTLGVDYNWSYKDKEYLLINNNFAPKRQVTIKETLTFMLRCLTDHNLLLWDNVIRDSIKFGLIQENEIDYYVQDSLLKDSQFYTLLCRMLDKKVYLYCTMDDHNRSIEINKSDNIRYIDWFLKKNSI